jgi:V/A-type H+-transporting ATPase subunit E
MAGKEQPEVLASSGVDALITKLREQGVEAGRAEARALLDEARREAAEVLRTAEAQARDRLDAARKQAAAELAAGKAALETAMRDAVLEMKSNLSQRFAEDVQRLVSAELGNPDVLRQLIIEIVGDIRKKSPIDQAESIEVILPSEIIGLEELRKDPDELERGQLSDLVRGLTAGFLLQGVTFRGSDEIESGVQVRIEDHDVVVDLTDRSVAALLLQHLQPRFRAVLEGVVR